MLQLEETHFDSPQVNLKIYVVMEIGEWMGGKEKKRIEGAEKKKVRNNGTINQEKREGRKSGIF